MIGVMRLPSVCPTVPAAAGPGGSGWRALGCRGCRGARLVAQGRAKCRQRHVKRVSVVTLEYRVAPVQKKPDQQPANDDRHEMATRSHGPPEYDRQPGQPERKVQTGSEPTSGQDLAQVSVVSRCGSPGDHGRDPHEIIRIPERSKAVPQ